MSKPRQFRNGRCLACPDDEWAPSGFQERVIARTVAFCVCRDFFRPELRIGRREFSPRAIVTMPETAVHEDGDSVPWKNDIRGTRKTAIVKTEPVTQAMKK